MDFSLKNIFSLGANESVVGIDIGSSAIKVVQLKKKGGRAVLETYGEIALGPYAGIELGRATNLSIDRIKEALTDLLREANVTTKNAGLSIPLAASLITLVEMPDIGEKRMAEMIPIEARRYIPVPISEVSIDWWIIPHKENTFVSPEDNIKPKISLPEGVTKKVDVLLVAILNDALNKNRTITNELGLKNAFFEIELFSTTRASLDQGIEPVMILDMGAGSTKLYLVEHGIMKDSHIINRGSQEITLSLSKSLDMPVARAEEIKRTIGLSTDPSNKQVNETISLALDYIFTEANQVLLSFEKKYNRSISKVVLSGGGAVMRGFAEAAKVHFQADVTPADPFAKVVAPAFLAPTLKAVGPEFAVAVGLALR
ncbi:MAG: type IV pilus assembly protein PilM, partial [bacterium]|nr:type IV pilus assembly protein PilM [bacterium]